MKYLIKFIPLEPYTFGTDQGFAYPNEKKTGKESYYAASKDEPEQTMIFGTLRYLLLKYNGLLKTDFDYGVEQEKIEEVIGKQSFSFEMLDKQSFGQILEVSPVFILNDKEEILIRNPLNNVANKGYEPLKMDEEVETSYGKITMPHRNAYNSKKGYGKGYYNLATGEIIRDMFKTVITVGNRKNKKDGEDIDDAFFKRELKHFSNTGHSFAVYAEIKGEFPECTIGYMGKNKSAFKVEAELINDTELSVGDLLIKTVEDAFKDNEQTWYYALSDVIVNDEITYSEFSMIEDKKQRSLKTNYKANNYSGKIRKSEELYNLISRGSVFYKNKPYFINDNAEQIGYNKIVRLGGK
ncbi:MAG: hypothetical protein UF228_11320 [Lachnospiraceae bacterium]|nr:hypothetical protein [Lachnospiraceae bacterium]